jgi:hypothetical protein
MKADMWGAWEESFFRTVRLDRTENETKKEEAEPDSDE